MRLDMPRPYRPKGAAIYYVRVSVPAKHHEAVGKTALKRSLKTADPTEAKRRCPAVVDELRRLIDDAVNQEAFGYADVQAIAAKYREERRREILDTTTLHRWREDDFEWRADELQDVVEEERFYEGGDPNAEAARWGMARLNRFLSTHSLTVPGAWRTAVAEAIYLGVCRTHSRSLDKISRTQGIGC